MYTMGDENHSNGYHWAITLAEWWLSWVMVIMVSKDHGWWESASDEDFHGWWLPLWVKIIDCWHSLGGNYHWMKTLEAMKQVLDGCGWALDGYCVYEEWESWSTLVFSDHLLHSLTLSLSVTWVHGLSGTWSSDLLIFWSSDLNVTWSHGLMTTWFHGSWSLWHTGS